MALFPLGQSGHSLRCRRPRPPYRPLTVELLEERTLLTGTWTPLANLAPELIANTLLLSDGTVMAYSGTEENLSHNWYQLTPDSSGDYSNGTWTQLASNRDSRVYFPISLIQDGRVFVAGGEYGTGTNHGDVYDPTTNTWTPTPNGPLGDIGDVPSETLPDGRILVGSRFSRNTEIYDPGSNTWTPGAVKADSSSEESWILLPDQTILDAQVGGAPNAEKYIPSENRWVSAGRMPLSIVEGSEIGAGILFPDGRAFFLGANGRTGLYTPPADFHDPGTWVNGPTLPNNMGTWDAPAAMMPNGKVLCAVGPRNYNGPTTILEYDPVTNAFAQVDSPTFSGPPYEGRMLTLPSGQILWSNGHTQLYLYNPDGAPDPSWQPTISGVTDNGDGTFLLTGTQLNGISEGGGYGDDAEMSSNYPIVQLSDGNGNVFYARTFYWSNTGVATGNAPVSTYFTLPAGISPGDYSLTVVANGIASNPVDFVIGGGAPAPGGGSGHSLPAFSILPTVAGRATSAHPAPVAVVAEGDAELLSAAKSQPVTRAAAIFGAEENGTVDFSESGENTLVGDLASSGAVTFMSQDDHTESSFVTLSGRIDNEADLFPDALVDAFYAADPFSRQF